MKHTILVVGSSNTDMVVKTSEFPRPGQTVLGGEFLMNPGGKGANQAVAAARLGGQVRFIARLGEDIFGKQAEINFKEESLDIDFLTFSEEHASGVALITVAESGENQIVVASGANMDLLPEHIPDAAFDAVALVVMQCEIPLETVRYINEQCLQRQIPVLLNPAPAMGLSEEMLQGLYLITPNETETEIITGIRPVDRPSLEAAAAWFRERGVQQVVITLGKDGVYLHNDTQQTIIPAQEVTAIDTTGAGDVFNGALAAALVKGSDLVAACSFASQAAAVSVTRLGAQSAAPFSWELE
ncbi:ribokinase [Dyadobacter jejuensis]|uniref:Ribokinase n=2 Tax=Dyadobacter jejuensis TaxID=1082580 RepID=A0A316AGD3_9BACT|nr:ribokinase [Dyadobacter jejuensis]